MNSPAIRRTVLTGSLLLAVLPAALGQPARPDPLRNAASPILLDLPASGTDETKLDYATLPQLKGDHAVISPTDRTWRFQLHDYLVHHDGQYWCMWSQGPPVEDEPSQHIRYATSADGLKWSESRILARPPKEGYGYIARGFWVRDGELLALVAHFKGKGAFGVDKELKLEAHAWNGKAGTWKYKGLIHDNAINNFPPQKLASGEWMMTRRDARFNVSMLSGGVKALDDWQSVPVVDYLKTLRSGAKFRPDEPIWYALPDKNLVALFRDNGGSGRLFRAFSANQGRTWTTPVATNFPNATSKIFALQTSTGYRVLISNANPALGRRQLYLSISEDGLVFNRMALLSIPSAKPATLQYPHAIEHDGHLLVTFSRNKVQSEILKIPLRAIDGLREKKATEPGK
jgi:BNR repeat-like domain